MCVTRSTVPDTVSFQSWWLVAMLFGSDLGRMNRGGEREETGALVQGERRDGF